MIVLDSSVALKWIFSDEEGASPALALRDSYITGETEIAVPTLFLYEIANVLATKVKLTAEEAQQAFELLADFELEVHDLEREEYLAALAISDRYKVSVYDASYLVLAQRLDCCFITADRKFAEKVRHLGVVTLLQA
jgi:predicted nucleic acid-binding protein